MTPPLKNLYLSQIESSHKPLPLLELAASLNLLFKR